MAEIHHQPHQDEVISQLRRFASLFVKEFEDKVETYTREATGKLTKRHKILNLVEYAGTGIGASIGVLVANPVLGAKVGGKIGQGASQLLGSARSKSVEATNMFSPITREERFKLKKYLISVAVDIFKAYEQPLMSVLANSGIPTLYEVVNDAIGRVMNYTDDCDDRYLQSQADNLPTFLLRGFIKGESKGHIGNIFPRDAIYFQQKPWTFRRINKKVGLLRIDKNSDASYYKKLGIKDANKFGYRLLFDWELQELLENDELGREYEEVKEQSSRERHVRVLMALDIEKMKADIYEEPPHVQLTRIEEDGKETQQSVKKIEKLLLNDVLEHKEPVQYNLRQYDVMFTGRAGELEELHCKFSETKCVCLWGLQGIGKTQLAKRYAFDKINEYSGNVIWIDCSTFENFTTSFSDLCGKLNIATRTEELYEGDTPKNLTLRKIIENTYSYFKKEKSLFIFDNVTQFAKINQFLPTNEFKKLTVLITAIEDVLCSKTGSSVYLGEFSNREAVEYMTRALEMSDGDDCIQLNDLIERLGKIPQNLHLASLCINEKSIQNNTRIATQNFIQLFCEQSDTFQNNPVEEELINSELSETSLRVWNFPNDNTMIIFADTQIYKQINQERLANYRENDSKIVVLDDSVVVTYCTAVKYISLRSVTGRKAANLLKKLSFLSSERIDVKDMFLHGNDITDEEDLWNIVALLRQYSCLKVCESGVFVDKIVQLSCRYLLQLERQEQVVLDLAFSLIPSNVRHGTFSMAMQKHVLSIFSHSRKYPESLNQFVCLVRTFRNSEDIILAVLRTLSDSRCKDLTKPVLSYMNIIDDDE